MDEALGSPTPARQRITPAQQSGSSPRAALGPIARSCGCLRFALTEREQEVLELLAEGRSTRDVAQSLFVSHQAVTYHLANLLGKFQCANRTGLVARAFVLGILNPSWPPRIARTPRGEVDALTPACRSHMKDFTRSGTLV